ncbi:MAG: aminoacyl-tRNA hydrolase [Mycobacteriales bacterium]
MSANRVDGEVFLVVGLGNPGPDHAGNRHNVGFMVADLLAERFGGRFRSHKGRADLTDGRVSGNRVLVAKPKTYMNLSGGPVAALRDFYRVPADRMLVIHDELDLPYGALRVKLGGGDNGHNGLRSLRSALGTGDFYRLRVGIGRPPGRQDPAAYVLRSFSTAQRKELTGHVERAADAVEVLIGEGLAEAQNRFND